MKERTVISIDNGIFLCNDGTMWARKNSLVEVGTSEWIQLDNVPQPDKMSTDEFNDFVKWMFRKPTRIRYLD